MQELESLVVLRNKGIAFRLIELSQRAVSIEDVVRFSISEISVDEICKTILLKSHDGETHAVLLLGSQQVDLKKIQNIIGKKVRVASSEEVKMATGVEPGAVCPILLKGKLLVDREVMAKERINFGSGDHLYGLEIRTRDLGKVVNYQIVDVTRGHS